MYTFEYHKERAELAKAEFKESGLENIVTSEWRDVCENGIGLKNVATAGNRNTLNILFFLYLVFLDLPSPWTAIASAKEAFDKTKVGKICCFSPCIEQVHKTVKELEEQGFNGNNLCNLFFYLFIRYQDV